ncbi:MAG: hypothetical protein KGL39_01225 [Patescibacteria group bacterium]|nr:hypothetical protein [Patescibacteria group bacterium]
MNKLKPGETDNTAMNRRLIGLTAAYLLTPENAFVLALRRAAPILTRLKHGATRYSSLKQAAYTGDDESLEQIWDVEESNWRTALVAITAAKNGQLRPLRWLRVKDRATGISALSSAAGAGHLRTLRWLRAVGTPWPSFTMSQAAEGGHIHILDVKLLRNF